MRLILVTFLSLISFSLLGATFPSLDKFQVRTGFSSEVIEAEDLKARVVGFKLGVRAEDKLNSYTNFFFDISGTFEAGSNESVGNIAEFAPRQGMDLNNAGVMIQPFSHFSIMAGALDQGKFLSPLLIDSTAFAAVEQRLQFGGFYIRTQQAIPANNQLTQRVGAVDDATPYFGMELLGIQVGEKTQFRFEAGHFLYKDLSADTANISREMGNSVTGLKEAAEYNYEFEGINSMLQFQHTFQSGFITRIWSQYLYNDKAPEGRNRGQLINLGLGYKENMIYLESFRNESDSSPGFYNSKYYGHNNMQGNSVVISFTEPNMSLDIKYTKASTIEDNFVQSNLELITFNLVKFYEI